MKNIYTVTVLRGCEWTDTIFMADPFTNKISHTSELKRSVKAGAQENYRLMRLAKNRIQQINSHGGDAILQNTLDAINSMTGSSIKINS